MSWTYKTHKIGDITQFPENTFGFVYIVTHKPSGKSYIDAIRNKECISLRWDANSFEIENDTYTYKYQNIHHLY